MHHHLELSYEEYKGKNSSIVNCQIDKYIIFEKIGGGSYGQIFKAIND